MVDFDIQRCTRKCADTDRELKPGEPFYSVLVDDGQEVVRRDYCEQAWSGPPEDAIGWWKSQMPDESGKQVNWAPNDAMMHYFRKLHDGDEKAELLFVLTLLMIRKKLLRLEESETDEDGTEHMVVFSPDNEQEYRVAVCDPDAGQINEIKSELGQMLFADAA